MARRTLKLIAAGYLVKSVLLAAVWIAIPDLRRWAIDRVREVWSVVVGADSPSPAPEVQKP